MEGPGIEDGRDALEAVAFANDRIDDIHFDTGILSEIRQRARRTDVGEDEVVVVPDGDRAFGRDVRRPIGADRGEEAEALLFYDPLHVGSENSHGCRPSRSLAVFYGSKRLGETANPMRGKSD